MTDEKELKDQRIPIMMTPSEVEAIDDWMFKNRIRSRGEAIRRLCQLGLIADASETMRLALQLVAHYIPDPEHKKTLSSGRTLEQDVKHLCWAVIQEKTKSVGFRRDDVKDAMAAAERLTKEFKDLETEAFTKNSMSSIREDIDVLQKFNSSLKNIKRNRD